MTFEQSSLVFQHTWESFGVYCMFQFWFYLMNLLLNTFEDQHKTITHEFKSDLWVILTYFDCITN